MKNVKAAVPLVRAIEMDEPTVDNADRAERMMEDLLVRQADYLPELS